MQTTKRALLALIAIAALIGALSACQTHDPLSVNVVPRCDQGDGVDVYVTNLQSSTVPVAIAFGGPAPETRYHTTPIRNIGGNKTSVWSFPGSRPARITVLIGDVGWITEDVDYAACTT